MPKTVMMKIEIDDKVKNEERSFYNKKNVKILKERYDKLQSKDKNSVIFKEFIDE